MIAIELLREEADRLARDHFANNPPNQPNFDPSGCHGCVRLRQVVQELRLLSSGPVAGLAARDQLGYAGTATFGSKRGI